MGVPFEALLPYGIMIGLFGVTVRPPTDIPPMDELTTTGCWLVYDQILHKQPQETEVEFGHLGETEYVVLCHPKLFTLTAAQ